MQPSETVEGRRLVALRQRWIVEDRGDEVVHGSIERHDGLPDVDQLACAFADDVDAEHLAGVAMEDELEAAGGIAADLAARYFAVVGHADFVGHVLVGQLLFCFADEADFGNGVDAVGIKAGIRVGGVVVEGAVRGDAALLHGDRGECGESDDVADGVDVVDLGAVVLVDGNAAARVRLNAGGSEVEVVDRALAAYGEEQGFSGDALLAFEVGDDAAIGQLLYAFDFLAEAQRDAAVAEVIAERFDDLLVGEFEELGALFNDGDADAEDGEHAGILDADNAAAYNDESAREGGQVEDLVAVDDGAAVDGHLGRGSGTRADGDDGVISLERGVAGRTFDAHMRGIDEMGDAVHDVDAVARELRLGHVHFGFDHGLYAECEVGHGDLFLDAVIHAVDGTVVVAGEMQHGLAHSLRGNCSGVDADAADDRARLDDDHPFFHLGSGDGGALPGRTGADDGEVILDGAHAFPLPEHKDAFGCEGLRTRGMGNPSNGG